MAHGGDGDSASLAAPAASPAPGAAAGSREGGADPEAPAVPAGARIPLVDVAANAASVRAEATAAMQRVLERGDFVLGGALREFEEDLARFCGVKHAVGVGCGLDALACALRGVGVRSGDEVITQASTFVATALAVAAVGAVAVVVDCEPRTGLLRAEDVEAAVTARTRAVVAVHLAGQLCDMEALAAVARRHGLALVEDAAQAIGGTLRGRRAGSLGRAAAFSFYPAKNLGAWGDGGAVTTDDDAVAAFARAWRNYGGAAKYQHVLPAAANSRLDTMQAAVLRVKLRRLPEWTERRRALARRYLAALADVPQLQLPVEHERGESCWHLFAVDVVGDAGDAGGGGGGSARDALLEWLHARGIGAGVHYPLPLHHQPCLRAPVAAPACASGASAPGAGAPGAGGAARGPAAAMRVAAAAGDGDALPVAEARARTTLSLPLYPEMSDDAVDAVVEAVRLFFRGRRPSRAPAAGSDAH